ncbi:DUF4148 domain-containing protein [Alicycliphilus denitrificans]|uniref:DUF4148 domain-containing protein n=1 Tax=Alicycliphilus denitrificans TaxID=179636 RepID=UPI0038501EF0
MRNLSALLTATLLGMAGPVWAQSGDATALPQSQTASTGLSRAEVLADLESWHRAGMTYWPHPPAEMDLQFMGDYQAALARYQQLRVGQAFQATTAKYQEVLGK